MELFVYGVSLSLILGEAQPLIWNSGSFISYMGLFSAPLTQIAVIIQHMAQVSSKSGTGF